MFPGISNLCEGRGFPRGLLLGESDPPEIGKFSLVDKGDLSKEHSFVRVEPANVTVTAVKGGLEIPAETGGDSEAQA